MSPPPLSAPSASIPPSPPRPPGVHAIRRYVAIAVCIFFFVVLIACIHQICQRGCCACCKPTVDNADKGPGSAKSNDPYAQGPGNIQMTFQGASGKPDAYLQSGKTGKKGHSKLKDDGYIARP